MGRGLSEGLGRSETLTGMFCIASGYGDTHELHAGASTRRDGDGGLGHIEVLGHQDDEFCVGPAVYKWRLQDGTVCPVFSCIEHALASARFDLDLYEAHRLLGRTLCRRRTYLEAPAGL